MKRFIYDLETTGTNPSKHGIHQISGMIEIDGEIKEKFDIKVQPNPKALIDLEALNIAGVTLEQINKYKSMYSGYLSLTNILKLYVNKFDKKDKFFLVGYNNSQFDNQFLRGFFLQNDDQYFGSWFWSNSMDVMVAASYYLSEKRHLMADFKLKTVAAFLGIQIDESKLHDGVYDCYLTLEIEKRLHILKQE